MGKQKMLNVGFGNMVAIDRIVAIVSPESAPMKRLREEAKNAKKLIDATQGRRTRSLIITDSDHLILSAVQVETLSNRFANGASTKNDTSNDISEVEEQEEQGQG